MGKNLTRSGLALVHKVKRKLVKRSKDGVDGVRKIITRKVPSTNVKNKSQSKRNGVRGVEEGRGAVRKNRNLMLAAAVRNITEIQSKTATKRVRQVKRQQQQQQPKPIPPLPPRSSRNRRIIEPPTLI